MARKFDVIETDGKCGPQIKKSVALLLVRRLVAELVPGRPFAIRKLAVKDQPRILPKSTHAKPAIKRREYQHHIEPKLIPSSFANSEWMRYLYGYSE